jgi:hypothetical protein
MIASKGPCIRERGGGGGEDLMYTRYKNADR